MGAGGSPRSSAIRSRRSNGLQQAQDLLHPEAELAHELEIRDQQVHAHGHPDLRQHGIARGAEEGFDLQVLLDPFEEQFDLPAVLVDRGEGSG